jgi:hypothetical protein
MIEEVLETNLKVVKMIKNESNSTQEETTYIIVKNLKIMADKILNTAPNNINI